MLPNRTTGGALLYFGTKCPKPFFHAWLRRYIPCRRISFRTAGSCLSRVRQHRRFEVTPKSWTVITQQSRIVFCIGQDLTHSILL